jgi:hypothetical protein
VIFDLTKQPPSGAEINDALLNAKRRILLVASMVALLCFAIPFFLYVFILPSAWDHPLDQFVVIMVACALISVIGVSPFADNFYRKFNEVKDVSPDDCRDIVYWSGMYTHLEVYRAAVAAQGRNFTKGEWYAMWLWHQYPAKRMSLDNALNKAYAI